jgi:heme O synthase-like polyprenyltransferase
MWQDTVIALCQLAAVPAMIPSIRGDDKPAFKTSFLNAIIVTIITCTLITLGLWFSAVTASFIAICWIILAVQKWRIDSNEKLANNEV